MFKSILKPKTPYIQYVGKKLSIPAGWWTKGVALKGEDEGVPSLCMVCEFKAQRQTGPGKEEDMFKVGLLKSEDPHFGRKNMEDDTDFWWVGVPKMPSAFDICTLVRATIAEEAATEVEVSKRINTSWAISIHPD